MQQSGISCAGRALLISTLTSVMLAACGGGSSAGSAANNPVASAPAVTATPTTYAHVRPTQGDTLSFLITKTPIGGATTSYLNTGYWMTVNADGSAVLVDTYAANIYEDSTSFDANGAEIAHNVASAPTSNCTYAPGIKGETSPYSVGQTWSNASIKTCISGTSTTTYDVTNAGSITALEPVTENGVTFNALKTVSKITAVDRASKVTYLTDRTCWRDTVLTRNVKCTSAYSTIAAGATTATPTGTTTLDLVRYNISGNSGSVANPSVYAGGWTATYTGTQSGTCASITVLASGAISGTCVSSTGTSFSVTGSASADGKLSFTQGSTTGGVTFTGQLTPTSGSGSWTDNVSASGTWTITHK